MCDTGVRPSEKLKKLLPSTYSSLIAYHGLKCSLRSLQQRVIVQICHFSSRQQGESEGSSKWEAAGSCLTPQICENSSAK